MKPSIAIKKLKLEKPNKVKIAKHPMPYAAKNMFYDERWIEKQETGINRLFQICLSSSSVQIYFLQGFAINRHKSWCHALFQGLCIE